MSIKRVAVTGGAGQIAYQLLFRIAKGDLLGPDQPLALHILELPVALQALEGVAMELADCAFPLLKEIQIGSDPHAIFKEVDYALLVGSKPRALGMERGELLTENGKIFIEQGEALNGVARCDAKVLVVGNPCNTNCLIAMRHAPNLSPFNFHAMTRLDQNRAVGMLAARSNVSVAEVGHMTIWGNHSSTQVPDIDNVRIRGEAPISVIGDAAWLQEEFIESVQKRGAAIIAARGKSSAASAANAAIDALHDLIFPTPPGQWYSSALFSEGNPYGIDQNLIYSFPCRTSADGTVEIVQGLPVSDWLRRKMQLSERELIEERDAVAHLLTPVTEE